MNLIQKGFGIASITGAGLTLWWAVKKYEVFKTVASEECNSPPNVTKEHMVPEKQLKEELVKIDYCRKVKEEPERGKNKEEKISQKETKSLSQRQLTQKKTDWSSILELLKEEGEPKKQQEAAIFKLEKKGISFAVSTLNEMEALLKRCQSKDVPVFRAKIGPICKRDIMNVNIMSKRYPEYGIIFTFNVKTEKRARKYAKSNGIVIEELQIIRFYLTNRVIADKTMMKPCCDNLQKLSTNKKRKKKIKKTPCWWCHIVYDNMRHQLKH
jgi:translation initiation factor IF-2